MPLAQFHPLLWQGGPSSDDDNAGWVSLALNAVAVTVLAPAVAATVFVAANLQVAAGQTEDVPTTCVGEDYPPVAQPTVQIRSIISPWAADDVAPPLPGDDDQFWQNWVVPVPTGNYLQFPYLPDPDLGVEVTVPGDDDQTWAVNQSTVQVRAIFSPWGTEDTAPSLPGDDDQVWRNWVAPVQAQNYLWVGLLRDPEEVPAGSLYGIPDDDQTWRNWAVPAPVVGQNYLRYGLHWDPEEIPTGSLIGPPDEDFGPVFGSTVQVRSVISPWATEEIAPPLPGDEDFWSVSRSKVQTWSLFCPWSADDGIPVPAPVLAGDSGDGWQNNVPPVPASNSLSAFPPWFGAYGDDSLYQVQEDFWIVATIDDGQQQPVSTLWDPDAPTGGLFGQPDEDFWRNWVPPVQAQNYVRLPVVPDPDEQSTQFIGALDEEIWVNWVGLVLPLRTDAGGPNLASLWLLLIPTERGKEGEHVVNPPPPPVGHSRYWNWQIAILTTGEGMQ